MGNKRKCDLCGTDTDVEFTVTSKHLYWILPEALQKLNTTRTDHIAKHICEKCFIKIFDKGENNVSRRNEKY